MLADWGWDSTWAAALQSLTRDDHDQPARVTGQDRDRWTVQLGDGSTVGRVTGSFRGPYPVTGDWVTVRAGPSPTDPVSIVSVLPRRSAMSRGRAGDGAAEQVLASNVDVVWIVHGLDTPPNLRRLERYLAAAWESGAVPEIVLTKADLTPDPDEMVTEIESVAMGVAIHVVSVEMIASVHQLREHLRPGSTVALLGPSGSGKSTLINALAEAPLSATGPVRDFDRKGRHTTRPDVNCSTSRAALYSWIRPAFGSFVSGRWTRGLARHSRRYGNLLRGAGSVTAGMNPNQAVPYSRPQQTASSRPIASRATESYEQRQPISSANRIPRRKQPP